MAYYLHGTTAASLQNILSRIPEKPDSAWMCSDQDDFFYLWKLDNDDEDEDNLAEFFQGITSSEQTFLTCYIGTDAVVAGICTMAANPSLYKQDTQVHVLLIEIPDDVVEHIVSEDQSCDNMANACCIQQRDLALVNIMGYWSINVPMYSLPLFAASMLNNPYFSFREEDEYLAGLVHKLSKLPDVLEGLWDQVSDWMHETPLIRLAYNETN